MRVSLQDQQRLEEIQSQARERRLSEGRRAREATSRHWHVVELEFAVSRAKAELPLPNDSFGEADLDAALHGRPMSAREQSPQRLALDLDPKVKATLKSELKSELEKELQVPQSQRRQAEEQQSSGHSGGSTQQQQRSPLGLRQEERWESGSQEISTEA